MKANLKLVSSNNSGLAIAPSEHRATQAGAAARLRHTVSVGYRSATVYPLFTSRTHRPPQPFGHRRTIDARMIASRR